MLRLALILLLIAFVARAFWRVIDGVVEGLRGGRSPQTPQKGGATGVQMARDPVCGTFVVPDRAIAVGSGSETLFFCSAACRDAYRPGRRSTGTGSVRGRTA